MEDVEVKIKCLEAAISKQSLDNLCNHGTITTRAEAFYQWVTSAKDEQSDNAPRKGRARKKSSDQRPDSGQA